MAVSSRRENPTGVTYLDELPSPRGLTCQSLGGSVVHEEKLSAVLSDFARTMATDFPIQGILDHLVERIVDVLPVTAAG